MSAKWPTRNVAANTRLMLLTIQCFVDPVLARLLLREYDVMQHMHKTNDQRTSCTGRNGSTYLDSPLDQHDSGVVVHRIGQVQLKVHSGLLFHHALFR